MTRRTYITLNQLGDIVWTMDDQGRITAHEVIGDGQLRAIDVHAALEIDTRQKERKWQEARERAQQAVDSVLESMPGTS